MSKCDQPSNDGGWECGGCIHNIYWMVCIENKLVECNQTLPFSCLLLS